MTDSLSVSVLGQHLNVTVRGGEYAADNRALTHAPIPPHIVDALIQQTVGKLLYARPELTLDDCVVLTYLTPCYGVCFPEDNGDVYRYAR